ncbi:hypothetical protein [Gabonibacter chumensis]|uniref:hypothetical protein n=1 Tax=Gabonibacter chumensis TaxID=2972474 RepID=UPI0025739034|nr:hypothetical protein [Gabonibacter chumensis]MCR9012120.1 hypothetical protein [Gabonibacter chumensis]
MKAIFIVFIALFSFTGKISSQEYRFELSKTKSEHYTFPIKLDNELQATALLESGIHVMLIDSAFIFDNIDKFNLELIPCDKRQRMNLGGKACHIAYTAKGNILISSDVMYKGEIFILSNYSREYQVAIPVQNLYNKKRKRRIIKLDLNNRQLEVLPKKNISKKGWKKITMNSDTYLNMPAVQTELTVNKDGNTILLKGNYNMDLGNASFLFLLAQNKVVQEWLTANPNIKLQKAYNRKGEVIAKAFVPEECRLLGIDFKSPVIAITKALPHFTTEGDIGLKFFQDVIAIFDFDKGICYMKHTIQP